jgi:hypothetical protein
MTNTHDKLADTHIGHAGDVFLGLFAVVVLSGIVTVICSALFGG